MVQEGFSDEGTLELRLNGEEPDTPRPKNFPERGTCSWKYPATLTVGKKEGRGTGVGHSSVPESSVEHSVRAGTCGSYSRVLR